jgi:deoxyribonuclease (pyrimidine dimer)
MTRINLVDPATLTDKHLGAEYRELPRTFGLVRAAVARGEQPTDPRNPAEFCLGSGHVRFFYPRLGWLVERYMLLVQECRRRGRAVNFAAPDTAGIPAEWFGYWQPTPRDIALSQARIEAKLSKGALV